LKDNRNVKTEILDYVKSYYGKRNSVPSIRRLCAHFHLTNNRLYTEFPDGQREICAELNIPEPENIRKTAAALVARVKKKATESVPSSVNRLVLTEEQTWGFSGIGHIEGLDPVATVDAVLKRDSTLRKLLSEPRTATHVATFVEQALSRGWTVIGLVDAITRLSNAGLFRIKEDTARRFVALSEDVQKRGWDLASFTEIATRYDNAIWWEREYMNGRISLSQLEAKIGNV